MKWGLRIRIVIYFLVLGGLAYAFLEFNGSVGDKLYILFGGVMAAIIAGMVLDVNSFNPFWTSEEEE